jgi:hypothetical protein
MAKHAVRTDFVAVPGGGRRADSSANKTAVPCSTEVYGERLCAMIGAAQSDGIEGTAFGDLFRCLGFPQPPFDTYLRDPQSFRELGLTREQFGSILSHMEATRKLPSSLLLR